MDWRAWIGRESVAHDVLTPATLARFRAMLDDPAAIYGIHWCLCLPDTPTAQLGADGHPRRDETAASFLPPIPLPRRMWASSDVAFHADIPVGAAVERRSVIADIAEKSGSSGALAFVTIEHRTFAGDVLAVTERQTLVYREASASPSAAAAPLPVTPATLDPKPPHGAVFTPCEAMLFRYSAMTFNSHRIHYDAPYAITVEGHRGLVVHGPLTATLLLSLAQRAIGEVAQFSFRGVAPAIVGEPLYLDAERSTDTITLAARGPDGRTIMTATAIPHLLPRPRAGIPANSIT